MSRRGEFSRGARHASVLRAGRAAGSPAGTWPSEPVALGLLAGVSLVCLLTLTTGLSVLAWNTLNQREHDTRAVTMETDSNDAYVYVYENTKDLYWTILGGGSFKPFIFKICLVLDEGWGELYSFIYVRCQVIFIGLNSGFWDAPIPSACPFSCNFFWGVIQIINVPFISGLRNPGSANCFIFQSLSICFLFIAMRRDLIFAFYRSSL